MLSCWGLGFGYGFSGDVNVQCMTALDELIQTLFKAMSDLHPLPPLLRAC